MKQKEISGIIPSAREFTDIAMCLGQMLVMNHSGLFA
jgi:hypothetical protein